MKITLVYPPNRNIPSSPYGALPLLAGCAGAAGHQVGIVDANLIVFEGLLERGTLEAARSYFDTAWKELATKSVLRPEEVRRLQGLAQLAIVPFERVLEAARAGAILRTRELFDVPANINWAYDTIANLLRATYCLNPTYYLLKPGALDEFFGYLAGSIDNPIQQLVRTRVIDQILAQKPDLVAVTIPFNEQLVEGFALLKELKQRAPGLKCIIGGAIVSAYHKLLCRDQRLWQYADYAMPGEADQAFPAFLNALERGEDLAPLQNLYWRDAAGEIHAPPSMSLPNLNELPPPDWSAVPVGRYFLPDTIANYQTSRGCYYGKCTFCSFDIKQNFRLRKPELVASDIEHIQKQTGLKHFIFWDPLTPPKLMKGIAQWNKDRGDQKIFWGAETKFEKFFTQQANTDLLYEGGARFLQFGFESGSQRVLDLMVKGNDLSRVHLMLASMQQSKIAVSVQWFIGFPGEREEEARQSYRYLDEHRSSILLSSYMGTYSISPDDDVFQSQGKLYDIEIVQREDGGLDYCYGDGGEHYDREELHAAYMSRGDSETMTRMAFYLYLTQQPEKVREISNFERGGRLPERYEEIASEHPRLPQANYLKSWEFDVFTAPEAQGVAPAGSPLPQRPSHAVFVTQTQSIYALSATEKAMLEQADGTRSCDELLAGLGGDRQAAQARLLGFVRRGILTVPFSATPAVALAS